MFNPVQTIGAQTNGHAAKPRKKQSDDRSIELVYGQIVGKNPNYATRAGALYLWNKSHYELVKHDDDNGEKAVLAWLANLYPNRATPTVAKECFKTARMMARPLPTLPEDRIVIPLKNAYLELRQNGTISRTEPDRALGITYVLNADLPGAGSTYTPASPPPNSLLLKYLASSLPDPEVRDYLQELAGDTLIPGIRYQVATLLKGRGRNGKLIYTRLLTALHQKTAPMRLNRLDGFALTPLIGASLAIVDEVPKAGIDEQGFKTLVSGEEVTIDIKHRDPLRYRPQAKWVISTNNDQKVADNSDGFWRRLVIIPFDHQIPESQVIPCLDEKIIKAELVHFLDWCLIGLQRLLARGALPPLPLALQKSKQEAVEASNNVVAWLAENTLRATKEPVTPKDTIYDHYAGWCDRQRLYSLSAGQFWKALRPHFPGVTQEAQMRVAGKRARCVPLVLDDSLPESDECPFK